MKRYQNPTRLSRNWKYQQANACPTIMVNPVLLESARNLGSTLQETGLEALGLEGTSIKKLETARIFTVEQLASSDEATLLHIPHFGTGKVKRIKACLNSYLAEILDGQKPEIQKMGQPADTDAGEGVQMHKGPTHLSSKINSKLSIKSLSERIDKLERRVGFLESRLGGTQEI